MLKHQPTVPPTLPTLLIAFWVLTMISIPILRWVLGDGVLPWGVTLSVILQAAAVATVLEQAWGWRRTVYTMALLLPGAWAIEWVGSHTGWPFGLYHYTPALQPQVGSVPLLIPLAWLMMLPCAWAVAYRITGRHRGVGFVIITALALTAWDLFLDPQMVAWGYWVWDQPSGYFGIPWVNFVGWIFSAALLTVLIRPAAPPITPLLIIYAITWGLQSIGQAVFWQMPGPALVGFVGMGFFVVWSIAPYTICVVKRHESMGSQVNR